MVTVGMNYEVIADKTTEFEAVFAKVLEIMGRTDGHVRTRLYRDVAQASSYMILSEWSSRPAFDAFTGSAQFKAVTDWGKSKILASRPTHEIYDRAPGAEQTPAPAPRCPVPH
ncbi:hypothetical protein RAS1_11710 [Phycisphaerae bacterium RAS1]|nr:hypothetical protein RAS1_11710 [Phycisphaerae bacterium RAS1]